jgi:UDP-N-acetylmuramate: L-alanyl-gamma-D-glutamyl-meso-diaminopimelate ligase
MHVHILGVCGTFMGGVAALARELGHRVTGSDAGAWPPMSTQLEALGVEVWPGYEPAHLDPAPDVVVVGNVLSRGNAAVEYMLDQGIPYISGPQWLAEHVLYGRHVLAVAGTHGKTTTASLLAWLLEHAGLQPGFLIGGVPLDFGVSARLGAGAPFVVEADEYDTAFFDKRSKFVHYRPRTLVLNNLEFDHADIFDSLEDIKRQFHHLVRTVPRSGCIVFNGADANLRQVLDMGCWSRTECFDCEDGWSAAAAEGGFELRRRGEPAGIARTAMVGRHNHANALAAIAAACEAGVAVETALQGLADFRNVRRRLERVGEVGGVHVYDDFAHHPTAIRLTIEALRGQSGGRILAVLEPRSNTMRLGSHQVELAQSLADADASFVYARDDLRWDPTAVLAALGSRLHLHAELDVLVAAVVAHVRPGDRVLVMSNGDFGGIHRRLLAALGAGRETAEGGEA